MAEIPGTVACHAIVTDTCRFNRSDTGAGLEAVHRLLHEYKQCAEVWIAKGAKFHFVLTLERPSNQTAKPELNALDEGGDGTTRMNGLASSGGAR